MLLAMSGVRWLSTGEQEIWRAYQMAVVELNAHLDHQLRRDGGMPMAYYEVLVRLSEAPDRSMRMSELAARCRWSTSRLAHAVARLETAGWVLRRDCESDRRGAFAELTDAGFAVLAAAAPGHVTTVRERLFDVLTPAQIGVLHEISVAIIDGLNNASDHACTTGKIDLTGTE